ncbi:MAG: bifunctional DNA primase/polymerase [Phycisphaerales bacterium]|nr:bifunctional DNA primase/polymerase [Phycisphaerales bacterium]
MTQNGALVHDGMSRLDAARAYTARGYRCVPIPLRKKGPVDAGWPDLRLDDADLPQHFSGRGNIGLLLGGPSGGLTDVDLDCAAARELAPQYLPPTLAITGRASAPNSHWWYRCPGAVTRKHYFPGTKKMIAEIRSTGCQTVVGPSIHPSGEAYEWLTGEPARVEHDVLSKAVEALAAAVIAQTGEKAPSPAQPAPRRAAVASDDSLLRRAAAYLDAMPPAISGQGGHDSTYAAATVLVHGFGLDPEMALQLLLERYNPRCQPPWTERELRHKVEDAATKPHELPYGWLRDAPRQVAPDRAHSDAGCTPNGSVRGEGLRTEPDESEASPEMPGEGAGLVPLGQRDPESGRLVLSPRRTLPTAEAFVREFHQHAEGRTVHAYGGLIMLWRDNRYSQVEDEYLKHVLQPWLHKALRYVYNKQTKLMEFADFESNPTSVKQALDSIRTHVHLPASTISPSWLDRRSDRLPALEILPCKSLSVHIPTGCILAPTPALFTINALDFDYEPDPEPPERWIKFMEQLFGDDLESMELLQEWMGYCLTSDTSQQKMLLLVGPRRSGKGTIGRILRHMIGHGNVVGPTTSGLAGNFGLQPLIGKSLAIVSDARFGGENISIVVERLLCISGEDTLSVDRKFLGSISMKLPTRFMFLTNELPRLNDASTALAGRFLVLRLTNSFYGQEDPTLTDQLSTELPGILLWAIEGWKRLNARGRFVQPESVADAIRDLEDLASPVGAFVRECCTVAPGCRAWVDDLYKAWQGWCERDGRHVVSSKMSFGRDLAAAVPGITRRRGAGDVPFYEGISLEGSVQ